jgi:DNA-binding CsgD family transcriptional regulator
LASLKTITGHVVRVHLVRELHVKKVILLNGLSGGLLIAALRLAEYRFLVIEHSIEIYGALIALVFAAIGIRLGFTFTKTREVLVLKEVAVVAPPDKPFVRDAAKVADLGITPRELEILEQIASGKSTREIAEVLFVSENTVKTHASRLFDKLNVKRRTQAVLEGKRLRLIP